MELAKPAKPPKISITRGTTEMAEKKAKKAVKKTAKASKAPTKKKVAAEASDIVTLAQLAEEAGISPQRARQKLREAEFVREGRWSWEAGHKEIDKVRKILAPVEAAA